MMRGKCVCQSPSTTTRQPALVNGAAGPGQKYADEYRERMRSVSPSPVRSPEMRRGKFVCQSPSTAPRQPALVTGAADPAQKNTCREPESKRSVTPSPLKSPGMIRGKASCQFPSTATLQV